MKRKKEKNKKNRKLKLLITCLVVIALVIATVIYLHHGEWVYKEYSDGHYGADTYYNGGYGEIEVSSPGIYVKYSVNVKNAGTMICDVRESVDDLTDLHILFYELNPVDMIEISGDDTQEIYISSEEYSKVVIGEYTNDFAEADTSVSIGRYVTNFQKLGKAIWRKIYWIGDGKYEERIEEIFDIEL